MTSVFVTSVPGLFPGRPITGGSLTFSAVIVMLSGGAERHLPAEVPRVEIDGGDTAYGGLISGTPAPQVLFGCGPTADTAGAARSLRWHGATARRARQNGT
jgi:hypothetical protein